ncbi:MAG: queuosine precursor transporter, partial [bacterium]
GKHLWLRNNGSTLVSQLIDTIIVTSVFLFRNPVYSDIPYLPSETADTSVVQIVAFQYTCKAIMALVDTPLIYIGVHVLRRYVRPELAVYKKIENAETAE